MLDLEQELDSVLAALDASAIEYALCGGLAMAVHGRCEAPLDVDILIKRDDSYRATNAIRRDLETLIVRFEPMLAAFASIDLQPFVWRGRTIRVASNEALRRIRPRLLSSAMGTVDYSEKAIDLRIRQVSQLRRLCLSLGKAKPSP